MDVQEYILTQGKEEGRGALELQFDYYYSSPGALEGGVLKAGFEVL